MNQTSILAVDDSPEVLANVENYLLGYYEVHTATNGPEALGMIRNGLVPTILFTDIVMPGAIDGIGLARIVRESYPRVGILLMTGWSYDYSHGFPMLVKPFQLVEIRNWIEKFLGDLPKV